MQDWRNSMQGNSSSLLGQTPTPADHSQPDIMYGPEGPSSFTMDQEAEPPMVHPAELPAETRHMGAEHDASASDSNNDQSSGEDPGAVLHHGGTLIVAPPSVVKLVWAPELASKVQCLQRGSPSPPTYPSTPPLITGDVINQRPPDLLSSLLHKAQGLKELAVLEMRAQLCSL